jgi:hypothetical protein
MCDAEPPGAALLTFLWLMILIEAVSPVPALLTRGAAWVLLFRPAWFLRLVKRLYRGRDPA